MHVGYMPNNNTCGVFTYAANVPVHGQETCASPYQSEQVIVVADGDALGLKQHTPPALQL